MRPAVDVPGAVTLLVIAKAPAPGRTKTRLCPPLSLAEAAALAEAALVDTLAAADAAAMGRRVLVLDGRPGPWLPAAWEVRPQRGEGLDERIANAFAEAAGPALLVGMDTPQLTPALLESSAAALRAPGVGAVIGPAADGGYWAIGLRRPERAAFLGVPMSSGRTLAAQRGRLRALGIGWRELPALRDVDVYADALAVAAMAPSSRFARALDGIRRPVAAAGTGP